MQMVGCWVGGFEREKTNEKEKNVFEKEEKKKREFCSRFPPFSLSLSLGFFRFPPLSRLCLFFGVMECDVVVCLMVSFYVFEKLLVCLGKGRLRLSLDFGPG